MELHGGAKCSTLATSPSSQHSAERCGPFASYKRLTCFRAKVCPRNTQIVLHFPHCIKERCSSLGRHHNIVCVAHNMLLVAKSKSNLRPWNEWVNGAMTCEWWDFAKRLHIMYMSVVICMFIIVNMTTRLYCGLIMCAHWCTIKDLECKLKVVVLLLI